MSYVSVDKVIILFYKAFNYGNFDSLMEVFFVSFRLVSSGCCSSIILGSRCDTMGLIEVKFFSYCFALIFLLFFEGLYSPGVGSLTFEWSSAHKSQKNLLSCKDVS